MTRRRTRYVVDASVVIKLLVEEPLSDRADALFDRLAEDSRTTLFVPELLYTECANILWKYCKRFGMTEEQATQNLKRLETLALDVLPTRPLLSSALRLASRHDISVYDASYVAAAKAVKVPMLTADSKLARKMKDTSIRIVLLEELVIEG